MGANLRKWAKSRTVWVGAIAAVCNALVLLQIDNLAGMPVEEIAANKGVLGSQLTVIAAGVADVLAIVFRIRAKADMS